MREEVADGVVLICGNRRGADNERACEEKLAVFCFISRNVTAERCFDFDGVGQFVYVEACGKLHADGFSVSVGFEDDGRAARRIR